MQGAWGHGCAAGVVWTLTAAAASWCAAGDAVFWWQGRQTAVTRDHNGLLLEQLPHDSCLPCCTGRPSAAVKYGEALLLVDRKQSGMPTTTTRTCLGGSISAQQQLLSLLGLSCAGVPWLLLAARSALCGDTVLPLPAHPALLLWPITLPAQGEQAVLAQAVQANMQRVHVLTTAVVAGGRAGS